VSPLWEAVNQQQETLSYLLQVFPSFSTLVLSLEKRTAELVLLELSCYLGNDRTLHKPASLDPFETPMKISHDPRSVSNPAIETLTISPAILEHPAT
jgi:hypothetical protein